MISRSSTLLQDPPAFGDLAGSSIAPPARKSHEKLLDFRYSTWVPNKLQRRHWAAEMFHECGTCPSSASNGQHLHDQKPMERNFTDAQPENIQDKFTKVHDQMQWKKLPDADAAEYASLLRQCGTTKALPEGKRIHADIIERGLEGDNCLEDVLVQMYGKCGALEDARALFDNMNQRSVSLWASIIGAYAQNGQTKEALQLCQEMQQEGETPNKFAFVTLLSACAREEALAEGRWIHSCIKICGFESDVVVGTALVNMYAKCGSLEEAVIMFDKMPERNVISWTAMITAYAHHGQGKEALQLFQQMQLEGVVPNKFTFVSLLAAYASKDDLAEGKRIHARIVGNGFESDVVVGTSLLTMYGKCSSLEGGRDMFYRMAERNLVTWTGMIAAHVEHGDGEEALHLYEQMQGEGIAPNKVTFISLLYACSSRAALAKGKQIHAHIVRSGFETHLAMGNTLVHMYCKCQSLEDARRVFDGMLVWDVVSWTCMISALANDGQGKEALQLFRQMELEGVMPNKITFVSMLSACTSLADLDNGKQMHARIVGFGFELDVVLGTALIKMYGKCGSPEKAKCIYDKMPEQDVVTWNVMIAECGSLEDAQRIFDEMPERDEVSWNTLIAAYVRHGYCNTSLRLFQEMQRQGLIPNKITLISILDACASQAALNEGQTIHARIVSSGFEVDGIVGNALIHMYGRCGSVKDAHRVLDKMQDRDVVSWTTMIAAYAQHGQGKDAFKLFEQMQVERVIPNEVTLVNILCACSHAGLEGEGRKIFLSMNQAYGISPTVDHYNCMIDILGRAGKLDEGEDLINSMPHQATSTLWMTLLNACRMHCNAELGQFAADKNFELEPENAAAYIVLSNIYAAAGRWDDAAKVRKMVKDKGLRNQPGCSSIEVGCTVHEFLANDKCHPQREDIYTKLENLHTQMRKEGYVPDTNSVLHDVEEQVKEYLLSVHSEKLAIAFGLISTSNGTLRITKNLRVCNDCHSAIKFISKLSQREILVRDANRFHLFNNGVCSCADCW